MSIEGFKAVKDDGEVGVGGDGEVDVVPVVVVEGGVNAFQVESI